MLFALFAELAAAECPASALAVAVQHIGEMKAAWVGNDVEAFDRATVPLIETIPCIREPISPALVVELHHVLGIRSFAGQDPMGAQRSLSAVRELASEWRPNEGTLDAGSPMLGYYETVLPTEEIPLSAQPPGGWLVDGVPGNVIPGHRAFVLQALGRKDTVVHTGYYLSPSTLPVFDYGSPARRNNARITGTALSGALLVGAIATEIAATGARAKADDTSIPVSESLALLERGQTLQAVAIALGATGVVGATVTWVVPW